MAPLNACMRWLVSITKYIKRHEAQRILLIEVMFFILPLIFIMPIILTGKYTWNADTMFHWQRIANLAHGSGAFNSVGGYHGGADMSFYPWMTIVPLALLKLIGIPPVAIMDIFCITIFVLGENIAYYAFSKCYPEHLFAFMFALLYACSQNWWDVLVVQGLDGATLADAFVPLAFFGWLEIMRGHKSKMLVVGMSLIMFTHILTAALTVAALGLLTLLAWKHLSVSKLCEFAKQAVVTLLITAVYWLPMLILSRTNKLWYPELKAPMNKNAFILNPSFGACFKGLALLWNFAAIVGFILAIINWKKLSAFSKHLFIVGLACLVFNMPYLPWHFLMHTFVRQLQFPFRVAFLIQFIFSFLLVRIVALNWSKKSISKTSRMAGLIFLLFSAIAFSFTIVSERQVTESDGQHFDINRPAGYTTMKDGHRVQVSSKSFLVLTNRDMNDHRVLNLMTHRDYLPRSLANRATRDNKHVVQNHKVVHFSTVHEATYNDGTHVNEPQNAAHFNLPLVTYHTQQYRMYMNGKRVHPAGYMNDVPYINHLHKGHYIFTYQTPLAWYRYAGIIGSLLGMWLLFALDRKKYRM